MRDRCRGYDHQRTRTVHRRELRCDRGVGHACMNVGNSAAFEYDDEFRGERGLAVHGKAVRVGPDHALLAGLADGHAWCAGQQRGSDFRERRVAWRVGSCLRR